MPYTMPVVLTAAQLERADDVARRRHADAVAAGRPPSHGCLPEDALRRHVEGARGELAAAVHLGIDWDGYEAAGDVGSYQVRSTRYSSGCLLLHDWDAPDAPFILVTAEGGSVFTLRGWIFGHEGCDARFWKNGPRPCYWVPQGALHSMVTLPPIPRVGEKTAKGGA